MDTEIEEISITLYIPKELLKVLEDLMILHDKTQSEVINFALETMIKKNLWPI